VQTPRFQQAKTARSQSADLKTTLAGGGLAPVARNHDSDAAEQKKDLLVVAMPMDSDPSLGLQDKQIHVLSGEELLVTRARWLVSVGIEHPVFDFAGKLAAIAEIEIVGEHIPVVEETEPAMWGLGDTNLQEVIPAPVDHIELIMIVRAVFRIPPGGCLVCPRDFQV